MASLDDVINESNVFHQQIKSPQFKEKLDNLTINGKPLQQKPARGDGNCSINTIYLAISYKFVFFINPGLLR